jgi:hypothetical protein
MRISQSDSEVASPDIYTDDVSAGAHVRSFGNPFLASLRGGGQSST